MTLPGRLAGLAFGLYAVLGLAATELRNIELKHRSAEELIPIVRPVLEPGAGLSGADYRLFVRSSEKNFREIRELVQTLDVPQRMLRIHVDQSGATQAVRSEVGVSGDATVGNSTRVVVGTDRPPRQSGLQVENQHWTLRTERHVSSNTTRSGQFLQVLDGHRAFLKLGRVYTDLHPYRVLLGPRIAWVADVHIHEITTGFDVLPRVQGSSVVLDITPRFALLSERGNEDVVFQEMRTTVRATLGEWIEIGSLVDQSNAVNRAILFGARESTDSQRHVRIKVESADSGRR